MDWGDSGRVSPCPPGEQTRPRLRSLDYGARMPCHITQRPEKGRGPLPIQSPNRPRRSPLLWSWQLRGKKVPPAPAGPGDRGGKDLQDHTSREQRWRRPRTVAPAGPLCGCREKRGEALMTVGWGEEPSTGVSCAHFQCAEQSLTPSGSQEAPALRASLRLLCPPSWGGDVGQDSWRPAPPGGPSGHC